MPSVMTLWKSHVDANYMYNLGILKIYGLPHLEKVGWNLDVLETYCHVSKLGMKARIDAEIKLDPFELGPRVDWSTLVKEKHMEWVKPKMKNSRVPNDENNEGTVGEICIVSIDQREGDPKSKYSKMKKFPLKGTWIIHRCWKNLLHPLLFKHLHLLLS